MLSSRFKVSINTAGFIIGCISYSNEKLWFGNGNLTLASLDDKERVPLIGYPSSGILKSDNSESECLSKLFSKTMPSWFGKA